LTLENGTGRFSQNIGKELSPDVAQYLRRAGISRDVLVMQAMVWLCMVQFRVMRFGVVWFGAPYANLR